MINLVGDQQNFKKNIRKFFESGYIPKNQQSMFENVLIEAGHAAMHRNFDPSPDVVNTLLDIVENIMYSIFYAEDMANNIKNNIPLRK